MNPMKRDYHMRFSDLLKPDFQGAVLAALAVAPEAVKEIFGAGTLQIMWQLFKDSRAGFAFEEGIEAQEDLGLGDLLEEAGLTPKERGMLKAFVHPSQVSFGSGGAGGLIGSTRIQLARTGLKLYSGFHRKVAAGKGDAYFSLEPGEAEFGEARRLAEKFGASVVMMGHTHSAR